MRLCQLIFVFFLFPIIAQASVTNDLALWNELRNSGSPDARAVAMLAQKYPDWPGLAAMVSKIEDQQRYSGLSSQEVTALFAQRRPRSENGMTAYLNALGNTPQARLTITKLWREEPMDKSMQKMLHSRFGVLLADEDNLVRLDMLLDNNYPLLATDMAMMMGSVATQYTITRIGIAKGEIQSLRNLPVSYQQDGRILGEFLRKAADREDISMGVALVQRMGVMSASNAASVWKSRHILARTALEQGRIQDAYRLANDPHLKEGSAYAESKFLSGFIALKYLHDPGLALQHFSEMYNTVDSVISTSRAAYWAGRAARDLHDDKTAQKWFNTAALYPTTFFGQRAMDASHKKITLVALKAPYSDGQIKLTDDDGLIAGASYFYEGHDEAAARQFLMAGANKAGGSVDFKKLYAVAARYDDRNIMVKLARKQGVAGYAPPLDGFPALSPDEREQAKLGGMDNMALVAAIVRQESEFDPLAQSGAGARGMMQLMPGTASETARKQGIRHDVDWLQTRPDHNIRLGSTYLSSLLNRFDGSVVLAVAAYNAGPTRVNQWIQRFGDPRKDQIATEDWIELIPVGETRNYIQRVQEGEAVYRNL